MSEPGPHRESEDFETALVAAQARRRATVRLLGLLLVSLGLLCGGYLLLTLIQGRMQFAVLLLSGVLGLGGLLAGASLLWRSRAAADHESDAVDEVLSRYAPRILGGAKPEQLEEHSRRQRRRR